MCFIRIHYFSYKQDNKYSVAKDMLEFYLHVSRLIMYRRNNSLRFGNIINHFPVPGTHFTIAYENHEAKASAFQENIEEMFHLYYMHSDVTNVFNYSIMVCYRYQKS